MKSQHQRRTPTETNQGAPHSSTYDRNTENNDDISAARGDDNDTEAGDVSTGFDDEEAQAPDGGWGWMVTLAGFMVAFISEGMVTSFGLLIPELQDTFGAGKSVASLPPSFMVATFLLSGPMAAYLVKRWGCRPVGFCGGLVAAMGVAGSAYAPSIQLFILSFGLVSGLGVGLIYLPSVTMVTMYFNKKRGIVTGIITSGSGFGLLALAPLTEMLMERYGWRGCYIILAAVTLHYCVCASLMRPLPLHRVPNPPSLPSSPTQTTDIQIDDAAGAEDECSLSFIDVQEVKNTDDSDRGSVTVQFDGEGPYGHVPPVTRLVDNGHTSHLSFPVCQEEKSSLAQKAHHGNLLSSIRNPFSSHHLINADHVSSTSALGPKTLSRSKSLGHLGSSSPHKSHSRLPAHAVDAWLASQLPPSLSHLYLLSRQSSDNMASQYEGHDNMQKGSKLHLADILKKRLHHPHHHHHRHHHSDSRIICGRSLHSVQAGDNLLKPVKESNQWKSSGTPLLHAKASTEESHKAKEASGAGVDSSSCGKGTTTTSLDYDVIPEGRRRGRCGDNRQVFSLFLCGAFLIQLFNYVPPLFTPSYAYQFDISEGQVATILSIYGLLNTAGRLLAGVLVYCGIRTLHVYNVGILLSAVACFIFPLCTTFPTIAICLGLQGFFLGSFPPLQSVLLVEYLGLEQLISSFGTMCMVKAFAVMAGPPLAGELFTVTGTFTVPIVVCGAVLMLAALCHQLMDCKCLFT